MSGYKLDATRRRELLERAATADPASGPDEFSEQDLLAAGQDLRIDADTLRAVYAEHLERRRALDEIPRVPRPPGARVRLLRRGDELLIDLPTTGVTPVHVGVAIFGALVTIFAGFWTAGMARGFPLFALASIPLWAVAGFLLVGSLVAMRVPIRVRVNRARRTVTFAGLKTIAYHPGDVAKWFGRRDATAPEGTAGKPFIDVTVTTASSSSPRVIEVMTEAEKGWMLSELRRFEAGG